MVLEDLPASYRGNMDAREQMHYAQCLAGMSFSNALLGIVHSMAHKTGAAFSTGHIPHGCANAIYLPYVIRYNAKEQTAASRYAEIARRMGLDGTSEKALINSLCAVSYTHLAKAGESADRILTEVLEKAGLRREQLSWIVSTGYGRVSIPYADENVTEISCHGRGAHYFNPDIRTILDIGGQDSKAIRLKADGEVADFVMNDKCAAGTGRFLEMIARTLEGDIDDRGQMWRRDR